MPLQMITVVPDAAARLIGVPPTGEQPPQAMIIERLAADRADSRGIGNDRVRVLGDCGGGRWLGAHVSLERLVVVCQPAERPGKGLRCAGLSRGDVRQV